ncbi:uncharacterized protein [Primulina huaijiensis]|uniref:uncharacterized protein isoform X2 n=1 Tax=Primulina huaijiensis TaxID=1492673 RepID=UPI003CC767F2
MPNGSEMEEEGKGRDVVTGLKQYWWWAAASLAQLGWGISAFRKGGAGDSRLMPFKAFSVASLFVGASACAATASLRASGIHSTVNNRKNDIILVDATYLAVILNPVKSVQIMGIAKKKDVP